MLLCCRNVLTVLVSDIGDILKQQMYDMNWWHDMWSNGYDIRYNMIMIWYNNIMRWDDMKCWHSRCTVQLHTEQSTRHWVAFLILRRHNFKMATMTSFHTENCCLHGYTGVPATRQLLVYSTLSKWTGITATSENPAVFRTLRPTTDQLKCWRLSKHIGPMPRVWSGTTTTVAVIAHHTAHNIRYSCRVLKG